MTDERDPKVSQRYRDLPREEPSRELDQTILAAAHRAADKPHAPLVVPAGRHRWYFSLGAAAILVLAVAVTLQVERQRPDPELAVPPAPTPAPAPQEQMRQAPATKAEPRLRAERRPAYAPNPPAQAPAAPAPAPHTNAAGAMADSPAERSDETRGAQARKQVEQSSAEVASSSPSRPAADAVAAQSAAASPERELERIAELRTQGRHEEADKALAEFRKRYPDYRIPQAMREKVELRPAR
jgi:hypothetical protein